MELDARQPHEAAPEPSSWAPLLAVLPLLANPLDAADTLLDAPTDTLLDTALLLVKAALDAPRLDDSGATPDEAADDAGAPVDDAWDAACDDDTPGPAEDGGMPEDAVPVAAR